MEYTNYKVDDLVEIIEDGIDNRVSYEVGQIWKVISVRSTNIIKVKRDEKIVLLYVNADDTDKSEARPYTGPIVKENYDIF